MVLKCSKHQHTERLCDAPFIDLPGQDWFISSNLGPIGIENRLMFSREGERVDLYLMSLEASSFTPGPPGARTPETKPIKSPWRRLELEVPYWGSLV